MMLRSRLAAGLFAVLSLIGGATHLYAQDGASERRPRVEVGLGGWVITQGIRPRNSLIKTLERTSLKARSVFGSRHHGSVV